MVSSYPLPGATPAGGVEVSTQRLVEALAASGAEVTVVAPGRTSDAIDGPVRVIHVDFHEVRLDQPINTVVVVHVEGTPHGV